MDALSAVQPLDFIIYETLNREIWWNKCHHFFIVVKPMTTALILSAASKDSRSWEQFSLLTTSFFRHCSFLGHLSYNNMIFVFMLFSPDVWTVQQHKTTRTYGTWESCNPVVLMQCFNLCVWYCSVVAFVAIQWCLLIICWDYTSEKSYFKNTFLTCACLSMSYFYLHIYLFRVLDFLEF